jgi:hypothetical protein
VDDMSKETIAYAIEDAAAAVAGIKGLDGLDGLRVMNEAPEHDGGWERIARTWFPSHAPANFRRNKGKTLPPEDEREYVETFAIAARYGAALLLNMN